MTRIKKIISVLFVTHFFISAPLNATMRVTLRALNNEGYELEQVQAGRPFILEVSVEGADGTVSDPRVAGTNHFAIHRVGCQMYMINNKVTSKYTYATRIDKYGSYSIGPAIAHDGNKTAQSGIVTVSVGEKETTKISQVVQKGQAMFVRLEAQESRVVVGQKLEGTVTFYSPIEMSS